MRAQPRRTLRVSLLFAAGIFAGFMHGVPPASAQEAPSSAGAARVFPEETIRSAQETLKKKGFRVRVDGTMDDRTREQIRHFQSRHHLPASGELDEATLNQLGVPVPPIESVEEAARLGKGRLEPAIEGQTADGPVMLLRRAMTSGSPLVTLSCIVQDGTMEAETSEPGRSGRMIGTDRSGDPTGGLDALYGLAGHLPETTPATARAWVEAQIAASGNPRLKVGNVRAASESAEIVVEVVTVDGSLVHKLAFNRHPGFVRAITE